MVRASLECQPQVPGSTKHSAQSLPHRRSRDSGIPTARSSTCKNGLYRSRSAWIASSVKIAAASINGSVHRLREKVHKITSKGEPIIRQNEVPESAKGDAL